MSRISKPFRCLALLSVVAVGASLSWSGNSYSCTIPIRTIGALYLSKPDLVKPSVKRVPRSEWRLDASAMSVEPALNQFVKIKNRQVYHGVTFSHQRSLSIDARGPYDTAKWAQDPESADECHVIGQFEWQPPVIYVQEGARTVRILAASYPNKIDTTGCNLSGDGWWEGCPNLTMRLVHLKRPLGARRLILERFEGDPDQV